MAEMLLGYGYKLYFDGSEDEDVALLYFIQGTLNRF